MKQSTLISCLTPDAKRTLRCARTVSPELITALEACVISPSYLIQFDRDLTTYGLYEAALYVLNYQAQGHYSELIVRPLLRELRDACASCDVVLSTDKKFLSAIY